MEAVGVLLTGMTDKTAESAEQDQPARMCRLILLYTLRKMNPCRGRLDKGLKLEWRHVFEHNGK